MICSACGASARAGDQFCARCGAALPECCPECDHELAPGAAFCARCGARRDDPDRADRSPPTPEIGPQGGSAKGEVERRQMTVMFADLVGSTPLSASLDPEDLRLVINAYHACCSEVIEQFGGHVAKFMGDGVLAYFGYPQAGEGDAERAVHAGLELVTAVAALALRPNLTLQVRVGISTGLVVVGDLIGKGAAREQSAVGDTLNRAARLQELAGPNQVLLGPRTRRLIGDLFACTDLGERQLKGLDRPVQVFRATGARTTDRFQALRAGSLTPMVGRDQEIALLLERWHRAREGEGHVVSLSGEPGIGKSRVIMALQELLVDLDHIPLRYQCLPYYRNSPLQPVVDELERAIAADSADPDATKLARLEHHLERLGGQHNAGLLATLLAIPTPESAPALRLPPQRRKTKILEALVDRIEALASRQPLLIVFEDVHWIDPTSKQLLEQIIDATRSLHVLVVITARPDAAPIHFGQANHTAITLSRLSQRQAGAMIAQATRGKPLPDEVVEAIVAKTDGIPLFVEEFTKTVIGSGLLADRGDAFELREPLTDLAVPDTLHDSLTARLDQLGPVKEVAQTAAVIGREFSYELLFAIAGLPDDALEAALGQLVEAELVFQRGEPPDASYTFKHALLQETAANAVLRERRAELHARIAHTLAAEFPEVLEGHPELIAHHCTEAGLDEEAVEFWREAGELAITRSAYPEAVAHLISALQILARFPESNHRDKTELGLQTSLGTALIAARSFADPATGDAFARAGALARRLGTTERAVPALYGRWIHHTARAEVTESLAAAGDLLGLADEHNDPTIRVIAERALANTLFFVGDLTAARTHAERALQAYDPNRDRGLATVYTADPYVLSAYFLAHSLLRLGYPDQAKPLVAKAIGRARELGHVVTVAQALHHDCLFHQLARDSLTVRRQAEALVTMAGEHSLPFWQALGHLFHGWSLVDAGQVAVGLTEMRDGLAAYRATSGTLYLPNFLYLLGEACRRHDEIDAAFAAIGEALEVVEATGIRGFASHIHRIEGRLWLARSEPDRAEASLQRSLELARAQKAKMSELRAAVDLGKFLRDTGRSIAAYDLVAPLYGWFTEGFDSVNLREAGALLDELAKAAPAGQRRQS